MMWRVGFVIRQFGMMVAVFLVVPVLCMAPAACRRDSEPGAITQRSDASTGSSPDRPTLTPPPILQPVDRLVLAFVGDIMAHRPNFAMRDYSRIYAHVAPYFARADLVFGNLEFPIDPDHPYETYPLFNVHPEYVAAAIESGISVFSLANNHATDRFRGGIQQTLDSMQQLAADYSMRDRSVHYSGLRRESTAEWVVTAIDVGRWRIGFVAFTDFVNEWSGYDLVNIVGFDRPREHPAFFAWLDSVVSEYDLFVVSYHAGVEYQTHAAAAKLAFMRRLADAGVDVVWGHHPHVLQPWEVRQRPGGGEAVIMASLGNFVSGQTWFLGSDDWHTARAFTGDSAVMELVFVAPRSDAGPSVPPGPDVAGSAAAGSTVAASDLRFHSAQAIPISHFVEPDGAVVVRPFRSIFAELAPDDPWHTYYRNRYDAVVPLIVDRRVVADCSLPLAAGFW